MPRKTSPPFELSPGFDAEGQEITHASVRMLTNVEREIAKTTSRSKAAAEIKAAQSQLPKGEELDPIMKFAIMQGVEKQEFFVWNIHAFITREGAIIEDRGKITQYRGLLLETDEEIIADEQEALVNIYRRPKFRPKHKCDKCGSDVECKAEGA
jgi:hypothetical protein